MGVVERDSLSQLRLPPGFRFYPTDEELLVQYLCRKIAGHDFSLRIIGEIDLYKFDPWFLPSKAIFGEKEWYFFSPRDRKYPNGSRPNRVAGSGYWKATGSDRVITTKGRKVGIKKALVFYVGKAPKGTKTNWIMHEYRISEPPKNNGSSRLDDWVLCRIYKKHSSGEMSMNGVPSEEHSHASSSSCSSQFDGMIKSLPEIEDHFFNLPRVNSLKAVPQDDTKFNLQSLGSGGVDWASLDGLTSLPELVPGVQVQGGLKQGQSNSNQNAIYVPYTSQFFNVNSQISNSVDEEVESGFRTHRIDYNPGFHHQQNLNQYGVAQSQTFTNSIDSFGNRGYSTQPGSFLFSQ